MQYDYFLASRYRNKETVLQLCKKLEEKGKRVYCFITSDTSLKHVGSVEDDTEEAMKKFESKENWREDKGVQEIFEMDMDALRNAHSLVLLLPAGKSAHMEAGAAYGMGKKCILVGEQKETESLYLIFDEAYPTIEAFIATI